MYAKAQDVKAIYVWDWNERFLPDPDGYRTMDPASILKDLPERFI